MSSSHKAVIDYYKILKVSRNASMSDIKLSYRKLAMEHHPDRHDGCSNKEAALKVINEAYSVLINVARKREYDQEYSKTATGSHAPRPYKVYAPSPPPQWNGNVWNHRQHYDYHYGDGFQKEAFRRMRESAKQDGAFSYQSPLGRGFTFDDSAKQTSSSSNANGQHHDQDNNNDIPLNPYSKARQGPPVVIMEYEEIDRHMTSGKEFVRKRERIVEDLHQRRQERYSSSSQYGQTQQQQRQPQRQTHENAAFARRKRQDDCVIL